MPHSSGWLDVRQIPTFSQQKCLTGTRLSQLCWSVHWSDRVWPGFAGSRSGPFDMNSGRLAFMLRAPRPAFTSRKGPYPQAPNLIVKVKFITWHLRHHYFRGIPTVSEAFLEPSGVSELELFAWSHQKRPCATLIRSVVQTTITDFFSAVEPNSFKQTLLSAVVTLSFCIYVLFIQYTCSINFVFFHVFFLAPNRSQQIILQNGIHKIESGIFTYKWII